jgi:hypothetical protein
MPATISLLRNKFEEEAVTFGYPRERVFRQVARVCCGLNGTFEEGPVLAQSDRSPNDISGAILSCHSAARPVAICPLPTGPGRFEHDLLQAITTGDENHEVEFAILLH